MMRRDKGTGEQGNEETKVQGKKRGRLPRSLSNYLLARSFNGELEHVETAYDRIPTTNRRFCL